MGLVAIILLSFGQTSLKAGLNHIGGFSLTSAVGDFSRLLTTPWVIIGFVCYGLSSMLWMDVLSKLDFSLAFPMVGSVYVFNLVIGRFFFHDMFGWDRMLGVELILVGIFFLVRSGTLALHHKTGAMMSETSKLFADARIWMLFSLRAG